MPGAMVSDIVGLVYEFDDQFRSKDVEDAIRSAIRMGACSRYLSNSHRWLFSRPARPWPPHSHYVFPGIDVPGFRRRIILTEEDSATA